MISNSKTFKNGFKQMNKPLTDDTQIYLSKYWKIKTCVISQGRERTPDQWSDRQQTLIYASKLKNSGKRVDHELSAKNLMIDLLISDIANSNVQNCSTGEQKRLVMAMELTSVDKPNLICNGWQISQKL